MKNFKKLSLLLSAFALVTAALFNVSCSDDDDPDPDPDPDTLTLTASPKTIQNTGDQYATFVVTFNGTDVTAQAKIFDQANNELAEARFASTTVGSYTFKAEYNNLSATETVTVTEQEDPGFEVTKITIDADKLQILANGEDAATFTVETDVEEANALVKIYDKATNEPLDGRTFTSSSAGEYTFFAKYGSVESADIKITVVAETTGTSFAPMVGFIRFSNIGCGPCTNYMQQIFAGYIEPIIKDKYVEMTVHNNYPNPADPYLYTQFIALGRAWGVSISNGGPVPAGTFDMELDIYGNATTGNQIDIALLRQNFQDHVDNKVSDIGFYVTSKVVDQSATVDVTIKATTAGTYTLGIGLLEDGLAGTQAGVSGTYTHNNTLRYMVTPVTGDELGAIAADATVEKTYTFDMDSKWITNNCKLFLYVTHEVDGETVTNNATYAALKGTSPYRYE